MTRRRNKPEPEAVVVIVDPEITPGEAIAGCKLLSSQWLPKDDYDVLSSLYLKLEMIAKTQETQNDG